MVSYAILNSTDGPGGGGVGGEGVVLLEWT